MNKKRRPLVYGLIAFFLCAVLILSTAYNQGADPFHPRSRHIWALSLLAAAYVSFRGAFIVDRLLAKKQGGGTGKPGLRGFGFFKSSHALDKRMAARKARVEAARLRRLEQDELSD